MQILELPTPDQITDQRYFQIQDLDKDGCGCCKTFIVSGDTKDEDIFQIACDEWTKEMEEKEARYTPSFFREPPKWRKTLKVIEQKRTIIKLEKPNERTGRDYTNDWATKTKGLKFTIVLSFFRATMRSGAKFSSNSYSFGKILK